MIPPDFIEELLARTDIVELVSQRMTLKKQGQNHSGLCPFHNEKTPSFSVSEVKQFYYCFGCQASGNALKFVMEFDRLDFVPAVELLAGRVGMEVPKLDRGESPAVVQRRQSIYDVLDSSATWYKNQLRQHTSRERAVTYLKNRGVSGEIARDFGLGYAPPGWNNLYGALATTNQARELLVESGMVIENQEDDKEKTYDRFRDRIMFPIRDIRGRVIAFGGRVIGDDKPKYLNSPETPVFHKGRELYGLYEARRRQRRLEQVMIVEGYMDVVALAQHGVDYCVATLGTATTPEHIERLFRMVSSLVFCFDGDTAGRNAGWKALLVTLPHLRDGRRARFLFVPDGEDPDSLIRKEGREKFEERIGVSPHLPDFFFEKLSREVDIDSMDGKAALCQLAMPLIGTISEGVFKQLMIQRLSEISGLSSDKLVAAWGARSDASGSRPSPVGDGVRQGSMPRQGEGYQSRPKRTELPRSNQELLDAAIALVLRAPEIVARVDEAEFGQLEGFPECELLLKLVRSIITAGLNSPTSLLAAYQETVEFDHLRSLVELEPLLPVEDLPVEFVDIVAALIRRLKRQSVEARRRSLLAKPFGELSTEERRTLRDLSRKGTRE